MNLSQILNPPGSAAAPLPATIGITHRQARSSSPPPPPQASATTVLRFDTPLSITTGGTFSRKHSNSVSVAQLEVQLSSPQSNASSPAAGSNNKTNGGSPGTYQKIKPNETNNGYSTHTFRASPPVHPTRESTIALSMPSSITTTAVSPIVTGTSTTTTTGGLAGGGAGNGGVAILGPLVMSHNTPQEMSSSLSTAKKKPRNQAESPSSFQDSFHSTPMELLDSKALSGTKKKLTRKGGRASSNQPETESQPLEIRFVMTDKDGQDRQRSLKQGSSSTSTSQDMQCDDAADQELSLPSPTPDFDRNADGKFRCSWPRCGKEFTVASRLTTHYRIHSGKPPYLCGYKDCQKAFHTSSSLSHHRVVHTDQGLRPYVCRHNRCGATYTQLARLITHQRTTHSGTILFIPQESSSSATSSPSHPPTQSLPQSASTSPSGTPQDDTFSTSLSQPSTPSAVATHNSPLTATESTSPLLSERTRGISEISRQGTASPTGGDGPSATQKEIPLSRSTPASRSMSESDIAQPPHSPSQSHAVSMGTSTSNTVTPGSGALSDCSENARGERAIGHGPRREDGSDIGEDEDSDEMRQKKEAALTMTSFREMAMLQHQRSQQPQKHAPSTYHHSTHRQPPLAQTPLPQPPSTITHGHHYSNSHEHYYATPAYRDYPSDTYHHGPPHSPQSSSYVTSSPSPSSKVPSGMHSYSSQQAEHWKNSHGAEILEPGTSSHTRTHGQEPPRIQYSDSRADDSRYHHYAPQYLRAQLRDRAPNHQDLHYRGPIREYDYDRSK